MNEPSLVSHRIPYISYVPVPPTYVYFYYYYITLLLFYRTLNLFCHDDGCRDGEDGDEERRTGRRTKMETYGLHSGTHIVSRDDGQTVDGYCFVRRWTGRVG